MSIAGSTYWGPTIFGPPNENVPRLFVDNGSAAAPSMAFINDTNTGLFRSSSDTLGISAGGSSRLTIGSSSTTSSNVILNNPGTVSLPGYAFDGDEDTGMYRVSANKIGFTASGSQQLTLGGFPTLATFFNPILCTSIAANLFGHLRFDATTSQSITATQDTDVKFPTSVVNQFSSEMVISGTGNTTFTVSASDPKLLHIAFSVRFETSTTGTIYTWIEYSGSTTRYGQSLQAVSSQIGSCTGSAVILVADGESIKIRVNSTGNNTISTGTAHLASSLTITQLVNRS